EPNGSLVFDYLLSALLEVTESSFGFISSALLKADGTPYLKTHAMTNVAWTKELRAWYAANAHKGLVFTNMNTLHGAVVLSGQQVLSNDARNDPRARGVPPGHPVIEKFMGIPLYTEDGCGWVRLSVVGCGGLHGAVVLLGQRVLSNDAHRASGVPPGHPVIEKFMGIPLYTGTELIGIFGVANRLQGYDEQLVKERGTDVFVRSHLPSVSLRVGESGQRAVWGRTRRPSNSESYRVSRGTDLVDPTSGSPLSPCSSPS
ncbi:unnamed protein product, partial [Closterium sp. NIES-54]